MSVAVTEHRPTLRSPPHVITISNTSYFYCKEPPRDPHYLSIYKHDCWRTVVLQRRQPKSNESNESCALDKRPFEKSGCWAGSWFRRLALCCSSRSIATWIMLCDSTIDRTPRIYNIEPADHVWGLAAGSTQLPEQRPMTFVYRLSSFVTSQRWTANHWYHVTVREHLVHCIGRMSLQSSAVT